MIRDVERFGDARAGAVAGAEKNGATVRQIRKDCVPRTHVAVSRAARRASSGAAGTDPAVLCEMKSFV